MKTFKRNAVIVTVLLFVCVAAYLNWVYNKDSESGAPAAGVPKGDATAEAAGGAIASPEASGAGLYYEETDEVSREYFDEARLNRQQARDAAAATLATVSKTEGASQEMVDAALKQIEKIASDSVKEAEIENLIKAKGFSDCVVYISDEGINVTVPAPEEGLPASAVAKITDIVISQTGCPASELKIIEVK